MVGHLHDSVNYTRKGHLTRARPHPYTHPYNQTQSHTPTLNGKVVNTDGRSTDNSGKKEIWKQLYPSGLGIDLCKKIKILL